MADTIIEHKVEFIVAVAAFGIGFTLLAMQPMWMMQLDVLNECYATKVIQYMSTLASGLRTSTEFVLRRMNDVGLYWRDSVTGYVLDLRMIEDIRSLHGVHDAFIDTWTFLKDIIAFPINVQSVSIPYVTEFVITRMYNLVYGIWDIIFYGAAGVIDLTVFSEDCGFCELDPDQTCPIMQTGNCSECVPYTRIFVESFIQLIRFSYINNYLDNLEEPLIRLLGLWRKPFFYVSGWISGCVSTDPLDIVQQFVGVILEWVETMGELLNALSNGTIEDFLDLIFSYALGFVSVIVRGIDYMSKCFAAPEYVQCLNNYPDGGSPGRCGYSTELTINGGIHECFEILNTCLDNPEITFVHDLFYTGFNLFQILPDLFLGLDYVICPSFQMYECLTNIRTCVENSVDDDKQITCAIGSVEGRYGFECVGEIPTFKWFADSVIFILETYQTVRNFVINAADFVEEKATEIVNELKDELLQIIDDISDGLHQVSNIVNGVITDITDIVNQISGILARVGGVEGAFRSLANSVTRLEGVFQCMGGPKFQRIKWSDIILHPGRIIDWFQCFVKCFWDIHACDVKKRNEWLSEEEGLVSNEEYEGYDRIQEEWNSVINENSTEQDVDDFIKRKWTAALLEIGLQNDSYCSVLIYSTPIILVHKKSTGEYMSYYMCMVSMLLNAMHDNHPIMSPDSTTRKRGFTQALSPDPFRAISGFFVEVTQREPIDPNEFAKRMEQRNTTRVSFSSQKLRSTIENLSLNYTGKRTERSRNIIELIANSHHYIYYGINKTIDLLPDLRDSVLNNGTVEYHKKWRVGDTFLSFFSNLTSANFFFNTTSRFINDYMKLENHYDNHIEEFKKRSQMQVLDGTELAIAEEIEKHRDYVNTKILERDLELISLYVDYVDEIRQKYYTQHRVRSKANKYISTSMNIYDLNRAREALQYKRLRMEDMIKTTNYVKERLPIAYRTYYVARNITKVMAIISNRYGWEFAPFKNVMNIAFQYVTGNITHDQMLSFLRGETEYTTEEGFIPKTQYDSLYGVNGTKKRDTDSNGPVMAFLNAITSYQSNERYREGIQLVFFNEVTNETFHQTKESIYKTIGFAYDSYNTTKGKLEPSKFNMTIKTSSNNTKDITVNYETENNVDFTRGVFASIDYFVSFFFRGFKGRIVGAYDSFTEYWSDYDPTTFIEDQFTKPLDRLKPCSYPIDVNGTGVYTPACLPLVDESIFKWIKLPSEFSLQIPWPEELIIENCVSTYNGVEKVFQWSPSDNCHLEDDKDRPLCPDCDYCRRYYRSCKSIGFNDWIDAILFFLGSFTSVVNSLTQPGQGVSIFIVRDILYGTLTATSMITGPFFPITAALSLSIAVIVVWILYVMFGLIVPYGAIVLMILVLVSLFVNTITMNFIIAYLIGVSAVAMWAITLFVPLPKLEYSFPIFIGDIIRSINGYVTLPYSSYILDKVERFDYTKQQFDIPPVDTMCFFWSFCNIAMSYIMIMFVIPFTFSVITGVLYSIWLYLKILFKDFEVTVTSIRTESISESVGRVKTKVKTIKNGIKTATRFEEVKSQIQRAKQLYRAYRNPGSIDMQTLSDLQKKTL